MLQLSRGVCAASVEVEVVICEQQPREVMVGTAIGLTLTTDRQTDRQVNDLSHGKGEEEEKTAYGDCRAEVVGALMETGHVKRPVVFPLQTLISSG